MSEDCEPETPETEGPDSSCVTVRTDPACGPLEVTVTNQAPTVDSEMVCNADTGVYDLVTITTTNGVAGAPVSTPTSISCDPGDPPLDVETFERCVNGNIHLVTEAFNAAGEGTVLRDIDTGIECNPDVKISNDCPDSVPVKQCADDPPFRVTVVDDPPEQITVNTVCVDGTIRNITFTDGVETANVDTGTACDDDTDIDVEYECIAGERHAVTYIDGARQATTVNTGAACDPCAWVSLGDLAVETETLEGIAALNGTLSNGVSYTSELVGGTNQSLIQAANGDTQWATNSILRITFDEPVDEFIALGGVSDPALNPAIQLWHSGGGVSTSVTSDGDPVTYIPGAVTAGVTVNGSTAIHDGVTPNVSTTDDWGRVVAPNAQTIDIQAVSTESMRFAVRFTEKGPCLPVLQCPETGEIRDGLTNTTVIVGPDSKLVACGSTASAELIAECDAPDQCWQDQIDPSAVSGDAANDPGNFDYDSAGASYTATNPGTEDVVVTTIDAHLINAAGSVGQLTFGGVLTDQVPLAADGVYRFTLASPVTVPAGGSAVLVYNFVAGGYDHSEANSSNGWMNDRVAVTFLSSETVDYSVKICDGEPVAYTALGVETAFNPDGDWVQIECPNDRDLLQTIAERSIVKIGERCFEREAGIVNTDAVVDTGPGEPISTPIVIYPNDTGIINEITVRAVYNGGVTSGIPFAIEVDGEVYEFDAYRSSIDLNAPTPPDVGSIPPARWKLIFPIPGGIQTPLGDPITINYVGPGDPQLLWTTAAESDGFQVEPFNDGLYAQVGLLTGQTERWSECTFSDKTVKFFGPNGVEVDSIPLSARQVRCDCPCDTPEEECVWVPIGEVGEVIPGIIGAEEEITAASGTLSDGTTYTVTNLENDPLIFSANNPGDIRWEQNSLIQFTFSNPVRFSALPVRPGSDVGNPIIWQFQANQPETEGRIVAGGSGPWTYNPGADDAQIDTTTNPLSAIATLFNPAVNAADDWGQLTADLTQTNFRGADNEAMRFVAATISTTISDDTFPAIQCPQTGEIRNAITNEPVTFEIGPAPSSNGTNSHIIEGCILADPADPDSAKISAFTVVGDDGQPLFAPRPLTDLGFETDCC